MFVGQFEHSLDDKGRLVLPTAIRNLLGGEGVLGIHESCLGLWTPTDYAAFVERLQERVRERETGNFALRSFTAASVHVKLDSQGRIIVPSDLREYAEIGERASILGVVDHVEIWSTTKWDAARPEGHQQLAEAVKTLGIF